MTELPEIAYEELIEKARAAANSSYSPYSKSPSGAALLTESGQIVTGCKIEIASYSGSSCAEATALLKALSMGFRKFLALAVTGGTWPCGQCRQMIAEFGLDIDIVRVDAGGNIDTVRVARLLPDSFGPQNLLKPLG